MSCDNPNHPNSCMKDCFIISQETARELLEAMRAINSLANYEGEQAGFSMKAQRIAQQAITKAEKGA